ncbi:pupal cuticle protein C1B-like [Episyrphus balteatus]|uniref:pupal cuticle protein C1B-like n=1 Tax=Episyrphus balteatus TaxID=286459 RepID=UPI00248662A5|nr:pupal cuticle protein C1B-like [Episyrphus balteatus]
MAFKVIIALVFFAATVTKAIHLHAPLGYSYATPLTYAGSAIGSTQENVVRSFGGTVSQYSKAVDTPFSSVRKSDTRINNNVYTPALATKTISYAAPAPVYAHPVAPAVYAHAAPVLAKAAIAYSPAATVAHVTFDGFGAHYVY